MKGNCNNFQNADKDSNKSSKSTHTSCESCDNRNKKTRKELLIDCNTKIPQGLPCFNHPTYRHKGKVEQNCNKTKNIQLKNHGINKSCPKCSCGQPLQVLLQPYPVIFPVCCPCCQLCIHNTNKEPKSEFHGIPPVFPPYGPENNESSAFTKLKQNHSSKHSSTSNCSIQTATPRYCIDIQGNMQEYLSENLNTDSCDQNNLFMKHYSNNCYESLKRHTSASECTYQPSETMRYPKSKSGAKENNSIRKSGSSHTSVRSSMSLDLPPNHSRSDFFKHCYNELSNVFQRDNLLLNETCETKKEKQLVEETSFSFGRSINISSEALDKFAMELLSDKFEVSKTSVVNDTGIPASKGISSSPNVNNFKSECSVFSHKVASLKNYDKSDENLMFGSNKDGLHKGIFNHNACNKVKRENLEIIELLSNKSHHTDIFQSKGNHTFSARSSELDESLLDDTGFNCLKSDVYCSSSSTSLTDIETNTSDAKTDHIHAVQNIIRQIEQDNFSEIYESIMNPSCTMQPSEIYENTTELVLNLEPNLLKDCEVKNNDEEIEFNSRKMQLVGC